MRKAMTAAVLVLTLSGLSACARSGEDGGTNPDVPATASPEEVVAGYLQALQDRDEDGAVALTIHAYGWGDGWSADPPPTLDVVEVGTSSPALLEGPVQTQWDDAVTVPAKVVVAGDEDVADGPADLTFTLWRGRVNDRWLIAGLGASSASGEVSIG
ncbi:hypothetical protein AB1207_22295 [Kineococcus endophyticus]|uniref:Lipoprotein n=1 Tax=Kineococcus endophyticus TaxID=1181883 RepID=A0ABV3PCV7_9ACTN